MSGGSLDYFCDKLEAHAQDLGDKELNELVTDLSKLFHDREWYLSGDAGEGTWNEARDAFKRKWFGPGAREERIEKYLAEFEDEIRKTFGISRRYCWACKFWRVKNTPTSTGKYGTCEFATGHLTHQCDCCERWEGA